MDDWWKTFAGLVLPSGGVIMLANWLRLEWQRAPYVVARAHRSAEPPGTVMLALSISNRRQAVLEIESYSVILPEVGPPERRRPRYWQTPFDAFGVRYVRQQIAPYLPGGSTWPSFRCEDRIDVGFVIVGDLTVDIRMPWRRFGRTHQGMRITVPIAPGHDLSWSRPEGV